jgi:hypothetical protein
MASRTGFSTPSIKAESPEQDVDLGKFTIFVVGILAKFAENLIELRYGNVVSRFGLDCLA